MTETQPTRPGDTRRTGSRSRIANERADRTMVAGAMTKAVRRARRLLPILTVCATTTAFAADDASGPLPVETFARFDDIRAARLSPSGADLAIATTGKSGRTFLAVVSLADAAPPKAVAGFSDADIRSFAWVNDDRLVFNTIDTDAPLNDQRFGPGLYSVKRDGSEFRTLIAEKWRPVWSEHSVLLTEPLTPNHGLLSTLRDGSDDVIVGAYTSTANGEPDAITPKRLNTANGHASSLALGAPPHGDDWVFDAGGRPRAMSSEHDGRVEIFWHELDGDRWTSIGQGAVTSVPFRPVGIDDRDRLLVTAYVGGEAVLKTFDFKTGKPSADTMVNAPGFDLHPTLRFAGQTSRLTGVGYETDAAATAWFDESMKALQAAADERFPGHVNVLQCSRCLDGGTLLVFSYSDQDPGTYSIYRAADRSWRTIGKVRNGIDPARMARVDFHRTKARDGEDLPIWVTTPPGKSDKPRAAVVLVHGGPWLRGGHWAWQADAQFLASRGYVVLEPEFRGSTGYGRRHLQKGFKQWGLSMQTDLVDAVHWAADRGLIDPQRVCIAGASYGGYATLMGLARDPDVYKCGVAWVAVSDPRLLYENSWNSDVSREAQLYSLPRMLGDPVKDAALLKDAAPVEHAKDMTAPLLLVYGGNDVRVPIEHGRAMRSALRKAGMEPEYVVYDGEGHGFLKLENRVDFYTRMERFLAKNLQ